MRVLVTGGAGFLGCHVVRDRLQAGDRVLNLDLLTYAGSEARVADLSGNRAYGFERADVADRDQVRSALDRFRPQAVIHLAAESHVTRSETDPDRFRRTNVEGTRALLETAADAGVERFVHVSTDEVYGPASGGPFREQDKPPGEGRATSAYARSKALADDLATGFDGELRVVVVRPTNCFGPWQHPEKAFARWTSRALAGASVPVWGDGGYVRQWLHADDLAVAIAVLLSHPDPERVYNVSPRLEPEITNLDLARWLLGHLGLPQDRLVLTAYDRPEHDRRYAVDPSRMEALGWRAGDVWSRFAETVTWYRGHEAWWRPLLEEAEAIYSDDAPR